MTPDLFDDPPEHGCPEHGCLSYWQWMGEQMMEANDDE